MAHAIILLLSMTTHESPNEQTAISSHTGLCLCVIKLDESVCQYSMCPPIRVHVFFMGIHACTETTCGMLGLRNIPRGARASILTVLFKLARSN